MERKEECVGCIPAYKGFGKISLLFTTNRIIIAKASSTGTLLLGGAIVHEIVGDNQAMSVRGQSPEAVLAANKDNYDIPYSAIKSVRLKEPSRFGDGKVFIQVNGKDTLTFGISKKGLLGLHHYDFTFLDNIATILTERLKIET